MEFISLGGVGGCELAHACRKLNCPAYPYDWIISSQSFVLQSFLNISDFFNFDLAYVYQNTYLLTKNLSAIILHDFTNFNLEKDIVITKYKRRFNRLQQLMENEKPILFIRVMDNLKNDLNPLHFYDNIYSRESESIELWQTFIDTLISKFNKKLYLLLITDNKDEIHNKFITKNNLFVKYTEKKQLEDIIILVQKTISEIK